MKQLSALRQRMFDIRPGEHLRTWSMFFYLLFVLFAYYIMKPVSRAMFLTKFDIDGLPSLYILIAVFGGLLAYFYSKLATKTSLRTAVFWAVALSVGSLVIMWWLIRMHLPWMIYVLNIWVSLFAVVSVSQGWLVASNLFDTREAKRLYPLLGMGMVLGAAFGGEFTNRTAALVGTENLLLASALMVVLAYGAFRLAIRKSGTSMQHARAASREETAFSFTGMLGDIARVRHLQIIVAMMVVMYLVDTLVEYQFQAMARTAYTGNQLTAFFGQFYGIYLNGVEFLFQLFVTALVVRRFGVGGTLQVSPVAIVLSSIGTVLAPGVASASAVRLTEASTRYTLNKTGMELLYMPLPVELRNRIKAFIDICVDRLSRGIAGVLLLLLTTTSLHMGVKGIAVVVVGFCVPWVFFSHLARREYVATIRKRLAARRLDWQATRIMVHDPQTVRLLETTAAVPDSPRQAAYAIELLAEAPGYDVRPLLEKLVASPLREVRDKVYEIAARLRFEGVLEAAAGELRAAQADASDPPSASAVTYLLAVAPDRDRLAAKLLDAPDVFLAERAVEGLRSDPGLAQNLLTPEWLQRMGHADDPRKRALAAAALGVRGDQGADLLRSLLQDPDVEAASAACRAAGALRNRAYLHGLVQALGHPRLRRDAIGALVGFGPAICGSLSDALLDETIPLSIRRQVPRVLKAIPDQRSVDVLLPAIKHPDLTMRAAVLKALNRLRESATWLRFDSVFVTEQILAEARHYCELNAALAPFQDFREGGGRACRLLARTIEERLRETLERLFRLLGLRYPPREIYSAYLAVSKRQSGDATAALEFLDSVLERDLKRILLPLLDAPEHLLERGRDLFGVELPTAESAVRELIRSHDPWPVACAMAAAAELRLRSLAADIAQAAQQGAEEISEVARSAESALAA
jgi:ATP:ADP antiporter, AAA family